jgi:hypothetical protein
LHNLTPESYGFKPSITECPLNAFCGSNRSLIDRHFKGRNATIDLSALEKLFNFFLLLLPLLSEVENALI